MLAPVLVKETMYVCPECGILHSEADQARNCCWHHQYRAVSMYQCPVCDEEYKAYDDAVECCVEKVEVSVACPDCGMTYEGNDIEAVREAQRCCHRPEQVDRYRCKMCESVYDDVEDADNCCVDVDDVQPYECGECGSMYANKSEAAKCCA